MIVENQELLYCMTIENDLSEIQCKIILRGTCHGMLADFGVTEAGVSDHRSVSFKGLHVGAIYRK